jgi:N-acetylglucosamine malate deacetylase 2
MLKILVVVAHPDDETMLTGGAVALLARAGAEVHYLCATRGEGGEVGEPPLSSRAELGQVREQEMRCAVQTLGGAGVDFLGYADPLVGEGEELYAYTDDFAGLVTGINAYLRKIKPGAVITHGSGGEYGHPAHKLTHQATRAAIETLGAPLPILYTFSAAFPEHPRPRLVNAADPAHLVLDVTPAMEQKVAAALCYKSQHALFVRRSSLQAGRQLTVSEVIMNLEGLHRASPPADGAPDDALARLLASWVRGKSNK